MSKKENKAIGEASPEQVEAWKKKYKNVFQLNVQGSVCYLRKPNRTELSAAASMGKDDPMAFNESILNDCWLGGDEAIKTEDELFLSACQTLATLVEVKQAEIKKL